jgi:hypothetical protein
MASTAPPTPNPFFIVDFPLFDCKDEIYFSDNKIFDKKFRCGGRFVPR